MGSRHGLRSNQMLQTPLPIAAGKRPQTYWCYRGVFQGQKEDWYFFTAAESLKPQKQTGTEEGCRTGLAEHHQGGYPPSGHIWGSQASRVITLAGFMRPKLCSYRRYQASHIHFHPRFWTDMNSISLKGKSQIKIYLAAPPFFPFVQFPLRSNSK